MRFLGIQSEFDLPKIQALRASPPGLATNGPRKRVFGAALEQWDSLLAASRDVVPAAAPILMFYALSQATRALCASRVPGERWNPSGHGLKVSHAGPVLGDTVVRPESDDNGSSFSMLCRALGESPLSAPTTLSALWAANPHAETVEGLGAHATPVYNLTAVGTGDLYYTAMLSGDLIRDLPTDTSAAASQIAERLADAGYPGPHDLLEVQQFETDHRGARQVRVSWRTDDGRPIELHEIAPGLAPGPRSGHYLRPALNDAGDMLSFLPLWWATLLALSSVARYSPDLWVGALARDRSVTAVPIEQALRNAEELLPYMLLAAMTTPEPSTS